MSWRDLGFLCFLAAFLLNIAFRLGTQLGYVTREFSDSYSEVLIISAIVTTLYLWWKLK